MLALPQCHGSSDLALDLVFLMTSGNVLSTAARGTWHQLSDTDKDVILSLNETRQQRPSHSFRQPLRFRPC